MFYNDEMTGIKFKLANYARDFKEKFFRFRDFTFSPKGGEHPML